MAQLKMVGTAMSGTWRRYISELTLYGGGISFVLLLVIVTCSSDVWGECFLFRPCCRALADASSIPGTHAHTHGSGRCRARMIRNLWVFSGQLKASYLCTRMAAKLHIATHLGP